MTMTNQEHAKYSPSQLARIIACPGSVKASETETQETNSYAEEGTMLHQVMEQTIGKAIKAAKLDERLVIEAPNHTLTREQLWACEVAGDYFTELYRELALSGQVEVFLETKTTLAPFGIYDCYGTADVKIMTSTGELHIIDWKFGQGIFVDAVNNPQFKAYALGSCVAFGRPAGFKKIVTHVVQPRLGNCHGVEYTYGELLDWANEILKPALHLASTSAPRIPGEEQCKWCLAKANCSERHNVALNNASTLFEAYAKPTGVSDNEVADLLEIAKQLDGYIKDLHARAYAQALSPQGFPGHKIVAGRSSRRWKNEAKAREWLLAQADEPDSGFDFEDLYESKFLTPPKAEKLTRDMKKNAEFQALIDKIPGKPTMVPNSDPREPLNISAEDTFSQYATK